MQYCRNSGGGYSGRLGAALRDLQGMFDTCDARADCAFVSYCCVSGSNAWGDLMPTCETLTCETVDCLLSRVCFEIHFTIEHVQLADESGLLADKKNR